MGISSSLAFQSLSQWWLCDFGHMFPKTSAYDNIYVSYRMKEFKCPDLLAERHKPYACRIRQWISQHILLVLPVCAMVSLS